MSLCDRCTDPGMCCREIRLNSKFPGLTKLETLAWLASVWPANGEIGVPFMPNYRGPIRLEDGTYYPCPLIDEWVYECPVLDADGRCGNYELRPNLCKIFQAGVEQPCAMYHHPCPSFVE